MEHPPLWATTPWDPMGTLVSDDPNAASRTPLTSFTPLIRLSRHSHLSYASHVIHTSQTSHAVHTSQASHMPLTPRIPLIPLSYPSGMPLLGSVLVLFCPWWMLDPRCCGFQENCKDLWIFIVFMAARVFSLGRLATDVPEHSPGGCKTNPEQRD